jgi:hypothetical protein
VLQSVQHGRVHAELLGVRPHVGQRDLRGFLHHIAELAGQLQAGFTGGRARFDVQRITAQTRHGQLN